MLNAHNTNKPPIYISYLFLLGSVSMTRHFTLSPFGY